MATNSPFTDAQIMYGEKGEGELPDAAADDENHVTDGGADNWVVPLDQAVDLEEYKVEITEETRF